MSLKIAVQMDPIEGLHIAGDSTFALMLEAQKRGHTLFYYTPENLSLEVSDLCATGCYVTVKDQQGDHFEKDKRQKINLAEMDVVLLRQDPPFDMSYITTTHLLEMVHPQTLVVNDPAHVRNAPEKLFVMDFPQFMPETLISRNEDDIKEFARLHKDIILKPLYGNGGAGIFRLTHNDQNFGSLLEMFMENFREPFVVQKYLPEVREGDKRIILVDGEIAGAINRVPAEGDVRSNMHVGGRPEKVELSARDMEICDAIGPALIERGLLFVGIDVIGGLMTEINVTSPTGIREVKKFGGNDIASMIFDKIEKKRGV